MLLSTQAKTLNWDIGWLWHTLTLEKSVSNILKNLETLQKEYEVLKVAVKKMRNGQ